MLLLLFFRRLVSVEVIPPGDGSTGLGEGRSQKGTGLNPAGPALAKTQGHWGTLGWRGMWLVLPHRGTARPRRLHEVTDNGISGEVKIGKIGSQGSSLC